MFYMRVKFCFSLWGKKTDWGRLRTTEETV